VTGACDDETGCLTNHKNKIPVDSQEFQVDILSTYFNAIYTVNVIIPVKI